MHRSWVLAIVILVAAGLGVAMLAYRLGDATRIEYYRVVDDDLGLDP
jgi:hypothetical protein